MATLADINIVRGDTCDIVLTFNTDATPAVPVDLTYYTAIKSDIRDEPGEWGNLIVSKELTAGITISGENDNILTIALSSDDTLLFEEGIYFIDIRFSTAESVETLLSGRVNVTYNITQI
jgi:hypothetical protein